jgi:hypothetical protein
MDARTMRYKIKNTVGYHLASNFFYRINLLFKRIKPYNFGILLGVKLVQLSKSEYQISGFIRILIILYYKPPPKASLNAYPPKGFVIPYCTMFCN